MSEAAVTVEGGQEGAGGQEAGARSGPGGAAAVLLAPAGDQAPADGGTAAAPGWLDTLPDELKSNPTLARYKSVDELARGHIEARAVASSRVPQPGDSDESFQAFVQAVRPESAEAYEIAVPEGQPSDYAEAMRPVFYDAGLTPRQVNMIVAANNAQAEAMLAKADEAAAAFQAERGAGFAEELAQVQGFMKKMGVDEATISSLEKALGTTPAMQFLWNVAEATGELKRVDGNPTGGSAVNGLSLEQAEARMTELNRSADHRAKITANDPAALQEHNALIARIAQLRATKTR